MKTSQHPGLETEEVERIYWMLRRIRRVEEVVADIYPTDKIRSPVHLSIGQEAVSVGTCSVLRADDVVAATYRGHAAYLAKGGSLKEMLAELYGKASGSTGGKGGSMHLVSMADFVLGGSAVVGTTIPVAVGYSLALKREGTGRVVVCFFGDGATEEGVFYESLNFSALHSLPILFVCENNGYAIHEPLDKRWAAPDLCARVRTFGVPATKLSDGDVFTIRTAAETAIADMRLGKTGPVFMECLTYRWREHVGPNEDFDSGYRDRAEAKFWHDNDPVMMVGQLLAEGVQRDINSRIEEEIEEAVQFADQSPFPDTRELTTHVYSD